MTKLELGPLPPPYTSGQSAQHPLGTSTEQQLFHHSPVLSLSSKDTVETAKEKILQIFAKGHRVDDFSLGQIFLDLYQQGKFSDKISTTEETSDTTTSVEKSSPSTSSSTSDQAYQLSCIQYFIKELLPPQVQQYWNKNSCSANSKSTLGEHFLLSLLKSTKSSPLASGTINQ